jgi:protoporphyrinogen/coproporphyrinogen III oxidase
METETRKVIVIGAGIAGLTCAYRLKQAGCPVTVVEAADCVGGVMRSSIEDDFLCERGPNSFQNTPEILELVHELGLDHELVTAEARLPRYIFYRGTLHPAPMAPATLLSTRLLTAAGKLRIVRELWTKPGSDSRDESLSDFVIRHFGTEVLRNFVVPFVSGIYAGDPSRLSARSAFPSLIDLEREYGSLIKGLVFSARRSAKPRRPRQLCSFQQGLQRLPLRLAERIGADNIILGGQVQNLRAMPRDGRNDFAMTALTTEGSLELAGNAVVIATPAYEAAGLLRSFSTSCATELASIEYPPLAGLCLAYRRSDVPHPLDGFGFLVPRDEGVRFLGCIWSSTLFRGRAPADAALLTIFVGGATDTGVSSLTDGQVVDVAREDLRTTLKITAAPRVMAIHRYQRAIPQPTLGHEARLQRIDEELRNIPGIYLVGNYLRGVSIPDSVKQAGEQAKAVSSRQ